MTLCLRHRSSTANVGAGDGGVGEKYFLGLPTNVEAAKASWFYHCRCNGEGNISNSNQSTGTFSLFIYLDELRAQGRYPMEKKKRGEGNRVSCLGEMCD